MHESMKNRVSDQFQQVAGSSQELVDHYPFSAASIAFGLGLGLGVAIATMMTDSPRHEERDYAHRVGQQVLPSVGECAAGVSFAPHELSGAAGWSARELTAG